ncbi:MAG TPA: Gfo/Idh/MocA family oxidoreductase, partial [Acetobacteraceae bacterium]
AELTSSVTERPVDDNAHMLLRFARGARGALWTSQVAPGHENALRIRIYGEAGGLAWEQESPDRLLHSPFGQTSRVMTRGSAAAGPAAARARRIPAGHPEGYLEAFAQLYRDAAELIRSRSENREANADTALLPDVHDGLRGVRFIEAAVRSSRNNATWVKLPPV